MRKFLRRYNKSILVLAVVLLGAAWLIGSCHLGYIWLGGGWWGMPK